MNHKCNRILKCRYNQHDGSFNNLGLKGEKTYFRDIDIFTVFLCGINRAHYIRITECRRFESTIINERKYINEEEVYEPQPH